MAKPVSASCLGDGDPQPLDVQAETDTEVVARTIGKLIRCDVPRIRAADPYPYSYVVLLASPIWNVRAPMIMSTFAERYDFIGKTIFPVTTHAMSGLGTTREDYAASSPGATIRRGLAVRGEKARTAEPAVEAWLRRVRLRPS
jgi:Flavodoxin